MNILRVILPDNHEDFKGLYLCKGRSLGSQAKGPVPGACCLAVHLCCFLFPAAVTESKVHAFIMSCFPHVQGPEGLLSLTGFFSVSLHRWSNLLCCLHRPPDGHPDDRPCEAALWHHNGPLHHPAASAELPHRPLQPTDADGEHAGTR